MFLKLGHLLTPLRQGRSWQWFVSISFLTSVLRSGPLGSDVPQAIWYTAQFGPFVLAGLMLLVSANARPVRRIDIAIAVSMAVFIAAALLSAVSSQYRIVTLEQCAILALMFSFLIVTLWRRWTSDDIIRSDLTLIVVLVASVQLVGLVAVLGRVRWAVGDYGRFEGLFSNANYAGVAAVVALMLALYVAQGATRTRVWIVGTASLILLIALLASGSRGALLALLAGIATFVVMRTGRNFRIAVLAIAGILAIGLLLAPLLPPTIIGPFSRTLQATDITSGRAQIYAEILGRWAQSPWLGTGYRTTELLTGAKRLTGHDVYLSVLAETGLLGAVAFLTLTVLIVSSGPSQMERRALLAAVVSVLAIELTESSLFGWGSAVTLFEWQTLIAFVALGRCEELQLGFKRSEVASSGRLRAGGGHVEIGRTSQRQS